MEQEASGLSRMGEVTGGSVGGGPGPLGAVLLRRAWLGWGFRLWLGPRRRRSADGSAPSPTASAGVQPRPRHALRADGEAHPEVPAVHPPASGTVRCSGCHGPAGCGGRSPGDRKGVRTCGLPGPEGSRQWGVAESAGFGHVRLPEGALLPTQGSQSSEPHRPGPLVGVSRHRWAWRGVGGHQAEGRPSTFFSVLRASS